MALKYDVRNLNGTEEHQSVMDSIESDVSAKAAASDTTTALAAKVEKTTTPTALTITATTGTLPTANGSVTVSDASTPTVSELLEAVVELNAKIEALRTALR